jgi:hypothetical protein
VQFAIPAQTGGHEERFFNKEIAKISKRGDLGSIGKAKRD